MARSTYIYVLLTPSGVVLGAFTVKHELETYRATVKGETLVERFRDGHPEVGAVAMP